MHYGSISVNFSLSLHGLPYFVHTSSEGSGKTITYHIGTITNWTAIMKIVLIRRQHAHSL